MNILFVGHRNNLNETIIELLSSQEDFEIQDCPPESLAEERQIYQHQLFDILVADLSSYPVKPTEAVRQLKKLELCRFLIAIHVYTSAHLIKPILNAGADGYLPTATTEADMLTAIDTISSGENYPEL